MCTIKCYILGVFVESIADDIPLQSKFKAIVRTLSRLNRTLYGQMRTLTEKIWIAKSYCATFAVDSKGQNLVPIFPKCSLRKNFLGNVEEDMGCLGERSEIR